MSDTQYFSPDFYNVFVDLENVIKSLQESIENEGEKIDQRISSAYGSETFNSTKTVYTARYTNPNDASDVITATITGTSLNKFIGADVDLATGSAKLTGISFSYPKDGIALSISGSGVTTNFDTGIITGSLTTLEFISPWIELKATGSVGFTNTNLVDVGSINATLTELSINCPQDDYKVLLVGSVKATLGVNGTLSGSLTELQVQTPYCDLVYNGALSITANNTTTTVSGRVDQLSLAGSDGTYLLKGSGISLNWQDDPLSDNDIFSLAGNFTELSFTSVSGEVFSTTGVSIPLSELFNSDGTLKDLNADGQADIEDLRAFVLTKAGVALPPNLAPESDTGAVNNDNVTNSATLTFTGSGLAANADVQLFNDIDNDKVIDDGELLGTATADGYGDWSLLVSDLAEGTHSIRTKVATDSASPALRVTIDQTSPDTPTDLALATASDTGFSAEDNITSDTTLQIMGKAEAGASVTLSAYTEFVTPWETWSQTSEAGTAIADANGNWQIMADAEQMFGDYLWWISENGLEITFTATQADVAGNVSAFSSSLTVTVDPV